MIDGRRTLSFPSLLEVMPDVDRLLLGHRMVGNWTLGQVCNHLSATLIASVDGEDFPIRLPWVFRRTIGPIIVGRMLKTGRMPTGIKIPEKYRPKPDLDARAEAEALRASIRLFGSHNGPYAEHPLAGPMGRETWERLHRIHCAHHLAFAVPDVGGGR